MAKVNPNPPSGEILQAEWFEHPTLGYLQYDPNTLYISDRREGQPPIHVPISLHGKFIGTEQPFVPTCSVPGPNNKGCPKASGCPFPKKFPHVGPGPVIMRKQGTVSSVNCYDYYEATRGGRPTSQTHYGMNGWKLDTTRTTIDVLGRTAAVEKGKLDMESSRQAVMASKPQVWQMEIGGLLPPWWPLMKKKGIPLPDSATLYPELADESSWAEEESKVSTPPSSPSVSLGGRKRRTTKRTASSGTASAKHR